MKPKDLKNSEELKSKLPDEPEKQENPGIAVELESKQEEAVEESVPQAVVKEVSGEPEKVEIPEPDSDELDEDIISSETESFSDKSDEQPAEVVAVAEIEDAKEEVIGAVVSEKVEVEETIEEIAEVQEVKETVEENKILQPEIDSESEVEEIGEDSKEPAEDENVDENEIETISDEDVEEDDNETSEILESSEKESTPAAVTQKFEDTSQDYSKLSQVELINALRDLLEKDHGYDIKYDVESIKSHFYKINKLKNEEDKKKFIDEGGELEDFVPEENPYELDIKDLLKKFRQNRIDYNKKQESQKEDNLQEKYNVIEEIKNLINNEESINKTFQEFRELQKRWRDIGLVPQAKMKDLWDTYHFHVENFYDYIKINKELRDLDLRKNLEMKISLCEKAEELLVEPSIIRAFNTLQKYHEQWREIGPVPRDKKDEIWERFKTATAKINKRHQDFFEKRKSEQKKNLEAKTVLCEKAEEIANDEYINYKDWDERSRQLVELQKVWRTIGFAPKRDNNRIYDRFRTACDKFFDRKRDFYSKNKELQQNNLQMKIDLCIQAESLKDNTDWKKTTQDFISIQKRWKEIGPVPRKHSDLIWKRFRAACDYFFEKKSGHFSSIDDEQDENLKLKEELIQEVIDFVPTDDLNKDLKKLKDFQRRWTEIGHVPIRQKDEIQNTFREAINKHFDALELDDSRKNILKFRSKVSNFSETSRGQNKMRLERDKYMTKLKQLENDLVLLDNNIGFFAQSKNAESLIADVNHKIEQTKEKIEFLKNKIRIIDEYDNSDE